MELSDLTGVSNMAKGKKATKGKKTTTAKAPVRRAKKTTRAPVKTRTRTVTRTIVQQAPQTNTMEGTVTDIVGLGAKTIIGVGLLGALGGAFNNN